MCLTIARLAAARNCRLLQRVVDAGESSRRSAHVVLVFDDKHRNIADLLKVVSEFHFVPNMTEIVYEK